MSQSCRALVESRKELEKEVLVSSLGAEGPQCMKNCKSAVEVLSTVSNVNIFTTVLSLLHNNVKNGKFTFVAILGCFTTPYIIIYYILVVFVTFAVIHMYCGDSNSSYGTYF